MKPKTNSKNPTPFTGKPAMGLSLANAVGNLYNIEEELKELEKPTVNDRKIVKNDKKVTSKPVSTTMKNNNAKIQNKTPVVNKPIANSNNKVSNNNVAQPKKTLEEEEVKRAPEIDIQSVKSIPQTQKSLELYKSDKVLEKDLQVNIETVKNLMEMFKNSQSFMKKINFPSSDPKNLSPTALYYYAKIFSAAMELKDPKYFRFHKNNKKVLNKFETILENCEKLNTQFIDPKFPPQQNWRSPEEFLQKDKIKLFDEISQENIVQGALGDCYLMGSLIVLSENPQTIKCLFKNELNKRGLYGIWLCESGAWRLLILDHTIPCSDFTSGPCYARARNNELWVMLLEKAYAKAYLGYKNIILGFAGDALKDLTGAPSEYIDLENEENSWKKLKNARKDNFVLCASSKTSELDSKLISKHNYAIVDLKEINKKELWLKLQNPLQGFSWKNPTKISPDVEKALIKNPGDEKKGIFWMSFKDFRENFEVVTCNKIHPEYFYSFYTTNSQYDVPCFFRALVLEKTHCYFSIHQKHQRMFKGAAAQIKYDYSISRIIVCKIEGNLIKDVVDGGFSAKQTSFCECWLEPGEYFIYAEVDFVQDFCEKVVISAYSSLPVVLDYIDKENLNITKQAILTEMFRVFLGKNPKIETKVTKYDEKGEILKFNGSLWGFVYFFFRNFSKNLTLYEAVTLTKCENIMKYYPMNYKQNDYFEVINKENECTLVLYKIGNKNNGSHACSITSLINLIENVEDKILIEKAIQEGAKNARNKDVTFFNYKYKGGNVFVYQNKGKNSFEETLNFKVLENINLILEKGLEPGNRTTISVKVPPNGHFILRLNIKNPFVRKSGFNYSVI